MAEGSYSVEVIPHLENETGEYDYVPTFEVRIDKGGKEKPSTARRICPERPPIDIIEKIDVIGDVLRCPYVSDFVDISHIVDLRRPDKLDAHRTSGDSMMPAPQPVHLIPPTQGERKHHGRDNVY